MKPTAAQTADTLTHIEQLAARLRILEPIIRHRAQTGDSLDGYPPGSGFGTTSGQGDPVGTVVALRIDHPDRDILGHVHADVITKLDQARRLLEQAESAGRHALPPTTVDLDDGCISCARIRRWSPIHRTRRCRWCADWAYTHDGEDPPVDILHAHHDGRRITTRVIETLGLRRKN